jgi:CRP-like cAMP-binding protein
MTSKVFDFLRVVPLFADLSEEDLEKVAGLLKERVYRRNDIVFFEEDTGSFMYFVKEGRVKVSRLLPNGKEMILAFHETGEYFGEMSLIDGGTAPASVTAVTNTTIYVLSARDFSHLLDHPQMNRMILTTLCDRCRDAWAQIEVLTFHNADARIRMAFYQLAQKRGVVTQGGVVIPMKLTHKELSDIVGISRETATRVLSHLQEQGLVKVDTRRFIITDPDRLVEELLFE